MLEGGVICSHPDKGCAPQSQGEEHHEGGRPGYCEPCGVRYQTLHMVGRSHDTVYVCTHMVEYIVACWFSGGRWLSHVFML